MRQNTKKDLADQFYQILFCILNEFSQLMSHILKTYLPAAAGAFAGFNKS
jgi:hypothetical protein